MQFEKKSVRLGDIRPSGQNPREDFGDMAAELGVDADF